MCPDKDAEGYTGFKLKGDPASMISSKIIFNLQACEGENCKPREEIDEFVKDLSVEQWLVHAKVDFSVYL